MSVDRSRASWQCGASAAKIRDEFAAGLDGDVIWDEIPENSDSRFNLNIGR